MITPGSAAWLRWAFHETTAWARSEMRLQHRKSEPPIGMLLVAIPVLFVAALINAIFRFAKVVVVQVLNLVTIPMRRLFGWRKYRPWSLKEELVVNMLRDNVKHFDVNDFRFAINHGVHFNWFFYSYLPNHIYWIPRLFRRFIPAFAVEIGSVVTGRFKANWFYLGKDGHQPEKKKYDGFIRVTSRNVPARKFDYVVLYTHGGAFLLGSPQLYYNIYGPVMKYAREHGVSVGFFSVEYTLAPEKAFPTQIREAESAFEFLLEEGYDANQILFMGDSAGGNLAFATAVLCRRLQRAAPRAVIAISPWLDLTCEKMSSSGNKAYDWISCGTKEELNRLVYMYTQGHDVTDPLVSPMYADLKGFPDVLLIYGGKEILYEDCVHFAQKAKENGVKVRVSIDERTS
jgi:acetyl esterase/lipase